MAIDLKPLTGARGGNRAVQVDTKIKALQKSFSGRGPGKWGEDAQLLLPPILPSATKTVVSKPALSGSRVRQQKQGGERRQHWRFLRPTMV